MNTPNPLVPQGSLQSRGKSTVRFAFFAIAAIHVVFIGGLLMQGCKKSETTPIAAEQTNLPPAFPPIETATNAPTNEVAPPPTNVAVEPTPIPTPTPIPPPVVAEPSKEYVVTKGDSFSTIAKKTGVSVKAISDANPGVNSTKLQVGQKLQIPAGGNTAASSTTSAAPDSGDTTTYIVKAGDMLEKIARRHGTTAKTIMQLNGLKSTMIKPGQKLKLPASKTPEPVAAPGYVTPLPPGTNGAKTP